MAASSTLSDTQREMLKHLVADNSTDFKVAQSSQDCCIYEVPCNLRNVNPYAYTPELIAIGPLHHESDKLKPMETKKYRYFQFFWCRCESRQLNARELLQGYKSKLQEKEERIRYSYEAEYPEYSKEKLVEMILLDAVFIMELFLRFSSWKSGKANREENHDYMFTEARYKSIPRDLLLLENQIPMFVLEELYDTIANVGVIDKNHSDFHELAHEYFEEIHWIPSSKQSHGWKNSRHFTDMIRYFLLPLNFACEKQESLPSSSVLKTATRLNEAGVIFEKVQNECLLDINFKKGWSIYFLCLSCFPKSPLFNCFKARFKIPQLKVDHSTECLLRNLIAFEQCHYPDKPYICNYVSLIDSLIDTKHDVELLDEKEVITHDLGSHEEMETVVNGLCKHLVVNETCYQKTIDRLNAHYARSIKCSIFIKTLSIPVRIVLKCLSTVLKSA